MIRSAFCQVLARRTTASNSLRSVTKTHRLSSAASDRGITTRPALVDGAVGVVVAPRGRLGLALALTIKDEKITEIDAIADPSRLNQLTLAVLPETP